MLVDWPLVADVITRYSLEMNSEIGKKDCLFYHFCMVRSIMWASLLHAFDIISKPIKSTYVNYMFITL